MSSEPGARRATRVTVTVLSVILGDPRVILSSFILPTLASIVYIDSTSLSHPHHLSFPPALSVLSLARITESPMTESSLFTRENDLLP
jgi:hypothetical protein